MLLAWVLVWGIVELHRGNFLTAGIILFIFVFRRTIFGVLLNQCCTDWGHC
jgi:hypothetical protein